MLQEYPEMAKAIEERESLIACKKLEKAQARKDAFKVKKQKESEIKTKILVVIWSIFCTFVCILSFSASEHGSLGLLIVLSFFCAIGGWGALVESIGSVIQMERDIQTASNSVEEYQKVLDARAVQARIQAQKLQAEEAIKHPNYPNSGGIVDCWQSFFVAMKVDYNANITDINNGG